MHRAFRYRLYPTPEQAAQLTRFAAVCRAVYNAAWEQRSVWWRQFKENTGKNISFFSQCRELTATRAEVPWVAEVTRACQEYALLDLDRAFANFFAGRSKFPRTRRRGVHETIRFKGAEVKTKALNDRWSAAFLSKVGWVRFRNTRPMPGRLVSVSVSQHAGAWFIAFACDIEHDVPANDLPAVGIDRGVAHTITLSTGEHYSVPASIEVLERRRRRAQRALARKTRGSARHARQKRRIASLSARMARVRWDWTHRVTTDVARRFGMVVLEDLNVVNMTASGNHKRGLNRAILNQGWQALEAVLAYKLEERGGKIVKINPAYTSQMCSSCGSIDPRSRQNQATFVCTNCGHQAHADINAAINIHRLGSTELLRAEVPDYRPGEARTKPALAA